MKLTFYRFLSKQRSVCRLMIKTSPRMNTSDAMPDLQFEKLNMKTGPKRKVFVGDDDDMEERFEYDSKPANQHLPPLEMFPKKVDEKKKPSKDTLQMGYAENEDAGLTDVLDKKTMVNSSDSNDKANIYVQVDFLMTFKRENLVNTFQTRSVVKPSVPIYPDIEKPLKAVIQEVLDTKVLQVVSTYWSWK